MIKKLLLSLGLCLIASNAFAQANDIYARNQIADLPNATVKYATSFAKGGVTKQDVSGQINACLAALPTLGGICDARGFTGTQDAYTTITIGANKTLLLWAGTFRIRAASGPGITLQNGSQLIGLGQGASILQVVTAGMSAIANATPTVGISYATVSNLKILITAVNQIGLDLTKVGNSTFSQLFITPNTLVPYTGSIGAQLDGSSVCSCANLFVNNSMSYLPSGMIFKNGGNSNQVVGGSIVHTGVALDFGATTNGNAIYGTNLEANTTHDVWFESTTSTNTLIGVRFEETAIVAILNETTNPNNIAAPYLGITGTATVFSDTTGALQITTPLLTKPTYRTIAQTLARTCTAASAGDSSYIVDTVGLAAPAAGGAVAGGGAAAVNNYGWCNGTSWLYQ